MYVIIVYDVNVERVNKVKSSLWVATADIDETTTSLATIPNSKETDDCHTAFCFGYDFFFSCHDNTSFLNLW